MTRADFIVVGAGSAGCVLAAELARREAGSVLVLEAGPSDRHPLVSIPFGLVWLLKSSRDWQFKTTPQEAAGGRQIAVPRGRMVGGSGSINSMVWFRGRKDDFDNWKIPGWSFDDVAPAFEAVENELKPTPFTGGHPLSQALAKVFPETTPSPEVESAGVFSHNMINKSRNSAAKAFLHQQPTVSIRTNAHVDRVLWTGDKATGVVLADGAEICANKGVILSAGSIASPAILMRSGIGAKEDLAKFDIDVRHDAPEVGANLHDHPGVGLHFEGPATGYGLELRQWPNWAFAPFAYAATRTGRLTSPTCEPGMFFNARGTDAKPDVQTHFIPFFLAHSGSRYQRKSGYFADVCLSRPKSRGQLRLASKDPNEAPLIDLGLLRDESDLDTMAAGLTRLRTLLQDADLGPRRGTEVWPGPAVDGEALRDYIRNSCGTAYHPVGTLELGKVVTQRLQIAGTEGLWAADASVMPAVTSANTNAPSMMIGWKGAEFIAKDAA